MVRLLARITAVEIQKMEGNSKDCQFACDLFTT
jgi:hypothetical protein